MHNGFRSLSFLLVLALFLAAPWSAAALPSEAPRAAESASSIRLFVEWIASLWGNAGCTADPDGGGGCDTAANELPSGSDSTDAGCIFDPNGGGCCANG